MKTIMKIIKIIKIVNFIIFLFCSIFIFYYLITTDSSHNGSVLNGSKIENGRYYLETDTGIFVEINEYNYQKEVFKSKCYKISLFFITIYLIYIWIKILILPNILKLSKKKF